MPEPTILDTILAYKRDEVAARQSRISLAELQAACLNLPPARGFQAALQTPKIGPVTLIAEVKKASPSAGIIREDFDPVSIACTYEEAGASCLSVLTDEKFFQGHDEYFRTIRDAVALPMIRKDFVVSTWQIYESRLLGADAVLLIAAALTPTELRQFYRLALSLGMDALVEVHTEGEMQAALDVEARLIGINSRDLNTFVTDLETVSRLAAQVPGSVTLVAESGLKTHADVQQVAGAGAKAILVGESLMRAADIGAAVRALMGA